jgi:proline iminopeptidase
MADTSGTIQREEGYVDVGPGRIWYESAGTGPRTILLLHGGPGASSDYLEPLMVLAEDGYRVVRYDQLGSYRSDKPDDLSLWSVPRFAEEVEIVRRELDLGRMHLLGQSWGSFLALEYAFHYQEHLLSLILYSGAASTAECVAGMNELRSLLPADTIAVMDRYEASGEYGHPDYKAAVDELYRRHLCRIVPHPAPLATSEHRLARPVYESMWGPNEFTCTGTLMGWDRSDRLGEIRVPTLITCGRHDEVVPTCSETMRRGIPGAELVIFKESSHLAHLEEPERYLSVLREFLRRTEAMEART